jgi:hypothetical protein
MSLFLGVPSPPRNPVYVSRVDPSVLVFSLSLHDYTDTHIYAFPLALTLSIHNKQRKPPSFRFILYNKSSTRETGNVLLGV